MRTPAAVTSSVASPPIIIALAPIAHKKTPPSLEDPDVKKLMVM
jgi:hypothetical protein